MNDIILSTTENIITPIPTIAIKGNKHSIAVPITTISNNPMIISTNLPILM